MTLYFGVGTQFKKREIILGQLLGFSVFVLLSLAGPLGTTIFSKQMLP